MSESTLSLAWALFAYAGCLAFLASWIPVFRVRAAATLLAAAAAVPVGWVLRGVLGSDPSYVTGLLAWILVFRRFGPGRAPSTPVASVVSWALVLILWILLVVSVISPVPADLYYPGLGYPGAVAAAMLTVAAFSLRPLRPFAIAVPASVLLALSGLHESTNAWDWFVDPPLVVSAIVGLVLALIRRLRRSRAGVAD